MIFCIGTQRISGALISPEAETEVSSEDGEDDPDTSTSSDSDPENAGKQPKRIPKLKYPKSQAQLVQARLDFPHLAQHSNEFFGSHSLTELIKLDDKLGGGGEKRGGAN